MVMKQKEYYINGQDEFVIENYNQKKPFASFLPAVAGICGKPMWVYYVNRGQGIATFGVNNKDYSIMEFQPANKAYRQTPQQGFRTFLKVKKADGSTAVYEPFQNAGKNAKIRQEMRITSYDFKLEDRNEELGIRTTAMFCTLPNESIPALVRSLQIENIGEEAAEVEVLDGMPVIIPYYLINQDMKNESNLRMAWMSADMEDGLPFYRIKALPYDTPETVLLEGGNFYLNFSFDGETRRISPSITDPTLVFGQRTDFLVPEAFAEEDFTMPEEQVSVGYTPCGFGYRKLSLAPGAEEMTYTLIGSAPCLERYQEFVKAIVPGYMEKKIEENRALIEGTKRHIYTSSSSREFDLYCGQTFMDNYLRGGYPIKTGNGKHTLYVYSRKHGDLEREYNFFQVDSTNYSQGNSNFRDVNQNRRNDVYFFPFIKDSGVKTFFQLLQLDGFNPLVLNGARFQAEEETAVKAVLEKYLPGEAAEKAVSLLKPAFTPGGFLLALEQNGITVEETECFINDLLEVCVKEEAATFQEGYWVDHWTYNNDLLEQYLEVFPDEVEEMVFARKDYTYYDNDEVVAPRTKRYVLTKDGVRQYRSLVKIPEKTAMIAARGESPNLVRTAGGTGEIYRTTLASKILLLLTNKIASLDAQGIGLEMEGNKPGWCDALNGLPGILGSSINESAEVKRLADLTAQILEMAGEVEIALPTEGKAFFDVVADSLKADLSDMEYWDAVNTAKEAYREKVIFGIEGTEEVVSKEEALAFVRAVSEKADKGLAKALDAETGVYHTYYINAAAEYEPAEETEDHTFVRITRFASRPIPPFLEGQVHMMRICHEKAAELHEAVKKSGMYDEKLDMFKVNADIMAETKEIGRQNVFPRGWLENEAVFLHMEYKYFLELLRSGQYEEFFHYLNHSFIPFLDPAVYGRSTLENCSFIASSAHPDERIHGAGYVSRLTGASTEFLHMWRLMTAGENVFRLDENGKLEMVLEPVLPDWLFTTEEKETELPLEHGYETWTQPKDTFACTLLGSILTVYHNPERLTLAPGQAGIVRIQVTKEDGSVVEVNGNALPADMAELAREGKLKRIDAIAGK